MGPEQDTGRPPGEDADMDTDMDTTPTEQSTAAQRAASGAGGEQRPPSSPRAPKPRLQGTAELFSSRSMARDAAENTRSPRSSLDGQLSPDAADRVFPVRSVISVEPTPAHRPERSDTGYFGARARKPSVSGPEGQADGLGSQRRASSDQEMTSRGDDGGRRGPASPRTGPPSSPGSRLSGQYNYINAIMKDSSSPAASEKDDRDGISARTGTSQRPSSMRSRASIDETGGLLTARFKHVVSEGGHAVITGRGGETLQRCEDEPIHIPGAVQGFGLLIALEEQEESKFLVRVVSENAKQLMGYTPKQLFALDSFTDILSEEQADNLLDHVDFIRDEDADVLTNGPEVFSTLR